MEKVEIKKKSKEDWDTLNKKIAFDTSYRFNSVWWIMFGIFCGICLIFLVFGIVVFVGDLKWDLSTNYSLGVACGACVILVFALFWITNNFINSKMVQRPDFPDEIKQMVKKQAIWMNVFRISTAVLTLICGIAYLTSGFMWQESSPGSGQPTVARNIISIVAGCSCLLFLILSAVSITSYCKVILIKQRTLNMLVPKNPIKTEVKA